MNKNSKLEYFVVSAIISLGSALLVLAVNLTVAGMFERFLWVLLVSMTIMVISKLVRKIYDRDAFSSKRSALHVIFMLVIRAVLFATGAVVLITVFLSNGELTREMDGITWINMQYLMTYVFVYVVIYILSYLISAVVLARV